MDGTLSLSCVLPFYSKPSALKRARMEEPVRLQTLAVVLVVGLGAIAVKVCGMHRSNTTLMYS